MNNETYNHEAEVLNTLKMAQQVNASGMMRNVNEAFQSAKSLVKPTNTSYAAAVGLYQENGRDFDAAIQAAKSL